MFGVRLCLCRDFQLSRAAGVRVSVDSGSESLRVQQLVPPWKLCLCGSLRSLLLLGIERHRKCGWAGPWLRGEACPGPQPKLHIYLLCVPGQMTSPLCACSLICENNNGTYLLGLFWGLNESLDEVLRTVLAHSKHYRCCCYDDDLYAF